MQLRIAVVLATATILSGCYSYPKTTQEFKTTYGVRETFTVPLPFDKAYQLILQNHQRCELIIIPGAHTEAHGSPDTPKRARVWTTTHSLNVNGIVSLIEIEGQDSNSSRITSYREGAQRIIGQWLAGSKTCGG